MIQVRRSAERGHANHGWLQSQHTFSFAGYHDPNFMGFGPLRVINEDHVAPGSGFPKHPHRNMEIISYVLQGAMEHKDSMGNGSVIVPGDVQRMSAGTGVIHSEFNHSSTEPLHFLQIWIEPNERGLAAGYEQKSFDAADSHGKLQLLVSADARQGSIAVHQDVSMYVARLKAGETVTHHTAEHRKTWLQLLSGTVEIDNEKLMPGDGVAVTASAALKITSTRNTHFILFDLAA